MLDSLAHDTSDSDTTISNSMDEDMLITDIKLASMSHAEQYLDNQHTNCPYDWYSSMHIAGTYSTSEYLNFLVNSVN